MAITDDNKDKLKNRLAKAMGHLNAVHRMVDEKKYCVDVLHQMKAVQAALDKISEEILRQHLETCVVDAVKNQDTSRVIDELIQVFRRAPELNLDDLKLDGLPQKPLDLNRTAVLSGNDKSCCN
jgi:DNA-binding FrmR family transcriptional regulator